MLFPDVNDASQEIHVATFEPGQLARAQPRVRGSVDGHLVARIDLVRDGQIIGTLDDLRPRTVRLPAVLVRPYVALLDHAAPLALSAEIALAFWIPFGSLAQTESWREDTVFARGIQINARVFRHQDHVIWGMTERILAQLMALLE